MVIWWYLVDSYRHYESDHQAKAQKTKTKNPHKLTIILTPRLTKQHHLINDFAIQNICAKNVQTKYKDKASLGQKVKHVNLL